MSAPRPHALTDLLSQRWEQIERDASLLGSPTSTLLPQTLALTGSRRDAILSALMEGGRISRPSERLEVHDVLGMGGMGVVHRGTQASLDREVAIKSVRPEMRAPDTTMKLLQEAWIGGRLQHPNIVPTYDIGVGGTGEPLIVQQRVDGTPWNELLEDENLLHSLHHAPDVLEWNIRILLQVCNAVAYAHSRGILHLDIKPSNVMVGPYGEVFLLDWGLAMALEDDGTGRLPLVAQNEDVIGTPAFMAPEMLAQGEVALSQQTDVYLLGATLYRICSGEPPHRGPNPIATMFRVATEQPAPLAGVGDELAELTARAMSAQPADRYATAHDLRLALEAYLSHRGAVRLADQARSRLGVLRSLWGDAEVAESEVRALFTEVRFGLEHAMGEWPEEPSARESLRELRIGMARWELARDRPQAAAAQLAHLDDAPQALTRQVEDRLAELQGLGQRVRALQRFRDQQDPAVGMRTRVFITVILGLCFTILPTLRALRPPGAPPETWTLTTATPFVLGLLFTALVVWARDSMTRSAINRKTIATGYILLVGQALLAGVAERMGMTPSESLPLLTVFWSGVSAMYTVHLERRLAFTSFAYVAILPLMLQWPEHQWWFLATANLILTLNVLAIWWPTPVWKPHALADPTVEPEAEGREPGG